MENKELDRNQIIAILKANHREIEKFGIRRIGLFGSFRHGKANRESDVDLLVEFLPGKKNFKNFMHLIFFLEEILQRNVDLVTVESLSPHTGKHILDEAEYVPLAG